MHASIRTSLPIAALLVLQVGCTQPTSDCTSAHGTFSARFDVKKADKDKPCGQLKVDVLGMQTYFAEGGVNGTPKFAEATVAIRAQYLYAAIYDFVLGELAADDYDENGEPIEGLANPPSKDLKTLDEMVGDPDASGDFGTSKPDSEGFCEVPKISKVSLDLPLIPAVEDDPETPDEDESVPEQPATKLTYTWDNVKFLVTADAQGTQFSADLKFTQDDCSASYHVVGVYPVYGCVEDEDCHDETSPLNPDFPLKCVEGQCVLDGEPPAYE